MTPFVTDPAERARISGVIREIVGALGPAQEPYELFDRALLRAHVAAIVPDDDDVGGAALAEGLERFSRHGGSIGLYGGVARAGWTVAHLTDGSVTEQVCAAIDAGLLREDAAWTGDYDLIRGITGVGVYALERGDPGRPLAIRVLDELERRAVPRGAGVAWHTAPALLPPHQRAEAPDGYINLGLAHGVPGPIALLAGYVLRGVEPDRAAALLDRAVAYVLGIDVVEGEHLPAWIAGDTPSPAQRMAWCYGDLGIGVALLCAAEARGNEAWRARACALARRCAALPPERTGVHDTGICHGAAGAAHIFHRFYRATGDADFETTTRDWLGRVLDMRRAEPVAGFPAFATDGSGRWIADATLLTGAPGVALVLAEMLSEDEPVWARLLLTRW